MRHAAWGRKVAKLRTPPALTRSFVTLFSWRTAPAAFPRLPSAYTWRSTCDGRFMLRCFICGEAVAQAVDWSGIEWSEAPGMCEKLTWLCARWSGEFNNAERGKSSSLSARRIGARNLMKLTSWTVPSGSVYRLLTMYCISLNWNRSSWPASEMALAPPSGSASLPKLASLALCSSAAVPWSA